MKSIISIVLISVFAFNFGGYHLLLKLEQKQLRKEIKLKIKNGISDDELSHITVTAKNSEEIFWKHNDEFSYKGIMYDLLHVEIIDEETQVYHALPDEKEHQLIEAFLNRIKKNNRKNPRTNTLKFFKILLKCPSSPFTQEVLAFESHTKAIFNYINLYHSVSLEISSPPPKLV